jgi:hypothetical protein
MTDHTPFPSVGKGHLHDRLAAIVQLARYAAAGRLDADLAADGISRHVGAVLDLLDGEP